MKSYARLGQLIAFTIVLLAKFNLAQDETDEDDSLPIVNDVDASASYKALEEFEPEYRDIPGLYEEYGIRLDKNHPLPITTRFVMEQIIDDS